MIGNMKVLAILTAALLAGSCAGGPPASDLPPGSEPAGEPAAESAEGPAGEPQGEFLVSEEEYTRTFEEIREFVDNLNNIIRSADYDGWLTYLSEQYILTTSDPAFLKNQSETPLLKQANVQLRSLRDYFIHVVVPSRTHATLDEIEFLDENHIKAIALLRGTRVILYLLERDQDQWKIGVW
jgi:hypothetical protein